MMKKRLASVLFGIIMLLSLPITTFAGVIPVAYCDHTIVWTS
ncbi:hypothetical protein [Clostridium kluyveri]|nr:hypothetical protein [Clostridium kluyveri]